MEVTGYVDRDALYRYYRDSDVLFAQLRDLPVLGRATFPSKPFEFMATGRPMIYAGRGITADFLSSTGSALIAEPESASAVADAISRLREDDSLRRELSGAGRDAASRHRRDAIMEGFAETVAGVEA